ncbi:MAG: hypothetical protein QXO32_08765 [Candidatus Bathyarchaeia archaeon]
MKAKRLLSLTAIFLSVWSFLMIGAYVAIKLLFASRPNPGFEAFFIAVIRVATGVVIAGLGLYFWRRLAHTYFMWAVKRRGIQLR